MTFVEFLLRGALVIVAVTLIAVLFVEVLSRLGALGKDPR